MVAELLVIGRIDEGQRIIDQLVRDGFEVTVAFWLKAGEYDPWHLYIASPRVDAERPGESYPALYASLSKVPDTPVQVSQVRLVNDAQPIARAAVALRDRYPNRGPTGHRGIRLGGLPVEEVDIYPATATMKANEIPIYGLYYRGAPTHALHLALEEHNPNCRLVVEEGTGQRHEYPADTSMTWLVSVPKGSTRVRDEIGRLVLAWDRDGERVRSDANEVWSLARLGILGFEVVREPA